MWWFLVLLGVLIALAGLAVIAFGAVIFVSTFGNTLITTGAVAASGGFVITAMGLVLRQLERLTDRIESRLGIRDEGGEEAPLPPPAPRAPAPVAPAAPRLSMDDLLAPEDEAAEDTAAEPPPAPAPERERAPGFTRQAPVLATPPAETQDPMVEARRQRLERRTEPAAPRPPARPPRTGYEPPPRAPRPAPEPPAAPPPPARRSEEEEPRILKSGIVGGMAYTLYSDGSIQADLPDGVVRFASLQELREHVAQSQGDR
ncbi:hypothetical protein ACI7BZ_18120 [Xanthobacter sp. AM11]|uniref:hypothetical protein n=1 Tax=Xanthobacter sp. AM11 TaxID=3380643 RepID=UPI0039BF0589